MHDLFTPGVGRVNSADIALPDHKRAVRFYSRVLRTGRTPCWRDDLMNSQGMPVIGVGARSAEIEALPLQWMPHIQVQDVGAAVLRALKLGGSELLHGRDKNGYSQWAVLLDPNGAAFGLIPVVSREELPQAETAPAGESAIQPGHIAWLDLTVPAAVAIRDFYSQVIGWTAQEVEMRDSGEHYADFNLLGADGSPAAGICHARGMNKDLPPVWLLYLPVGDLTESLRRVRTEGDTVLREAKQSSGEIAFAVIRDPAGACLALMPGQQSD